MALVNYEVKGHVAIVTLNRPDARNAINPEVAVRLADAWTAARDDANVRVIIVTGNGSAFCAGADLGQLIPMMSGARKPENEFDHRVIKEPGITSRALLRNFDTEKPVPKTESAPNSSHRPGPTRAHARPRKAQARWVRATPNPAGR